MDTEMLTAWQLLLELAYPAEDDEFAARDAVVNVIELLRARGQVADEALREATLTTLRLRGLA